MTVFQVACSKPLWCVGTLLPMVRDAGLKVTISSDDPAYMASEYINEVLLRAVTRSHLSRADLAGIARNGFEAAWLPADEKAALLAKLDAYLASAA
jgi:adenosine deaminase